MFRIFRQLRLGLFTESRTGRYFLYALGEIVLVVIGILLALQINNWNEAKSTARRMDRILTEIRQNLLQDIEESMVYLTDGKYIDSLGQQVLAGKLTGEQYRDPAQRHLFYVGLQYQPFEYQTAGFDKLLNFQGVLPPDYDSVLTQINFYYNNLGGFYNSTYGQLRKQIQDRHDYLAQNKDWYHLLRKREVSDAMIDFYLNDPIYKNWVAQHLGNNTAGSQGSMWFVHQGALVLNSVLENTLGKEASPVVTALYGPPEPEVIREFLGRYWFEDNQYEITLTDQGGYLFIGRLNYKIILMKKAADTYESQQTDEDILKFQRDTLGNVTGVHFISKKDTTRVQKATKL